MVRFTQICKNASKQLNLSKTAVRKRSQTAIANPDLICPHLNEDFSSARPYTEIPGPKPLPLLGNTWRLLPIIGQYDVSDVAKLSKLFYKEYGKIVKLSGLIGRPDLLFVYDADEIEKFTDKKGQHHFDHQCPV